MISPGWDVDMRLTPPPPLPHTLPPPLPTPLQSHTHMLVALKATLDGVQTGWDKTRKRYHHRMLPAALAQRRKRGQHDARLYMTSRQRGTHKRLNL